jgi:DNA-binding IclR family transcriptional regulator
MPSTQENSSSGTQSIQRAALLLRLLTTHNRTGMRLVDLYRRANLERPTAHRILQGLIAEGLVEQNQESKQYFLGPALYEMGLAAAPRPQLRDICHPHLGELARISGDTVFFTGRAGLDGVCLDRAEGAFPVKVFVLEIGKRRPLGVGGGGLAILAALDSDESSRILKANAVRLEERFPRFKEATVKQALTTARRVGYILADVVEVPGIRTLAMAVRMPDTSVVGAISISAMAQRLDNERLGLLVESMKQAVSAIEDELTTQPVVHFG